MSRVTGKVSPKQGGSQVGAPKARQEKASIVSDPLVGAHMKVANHVIQERAHDRLGESLPRQAQTDCRHLDIVAVQEI